jgi:hypothetical protein
MKLLCLSFSEEEQEGSPISDSFPVPTWSDALELLCRYNFQHHLYPVAIHPEFEERILAEIRNRGGEEEVNRWKEALRR